MKNIQDSRKLWKEIYKWRKISASLIIYSIIITLWLLITNVCGKTIIENGTVYNPISQNISEIIEQEKTQGKTETFIITAYCPCTKCNGKWAGGITSTGVKAQSKHTIAVDPKKIPYGTKVIIDGHTYIAEDCGGAIKGNRIDVYFDTHKEALNFGRQTKEVTILN